MDINSLFSHGICINRQQKRQICNKRARKLRKRGENVWWDIDTNTYCWLMWRNIKPEDFYLKEPNNG